MAVDIIARITCDMCGRTEELAIKESSRSGKLSGDIPYLVRRAFGNWHLVGPDGYDVTDYHDARGKVLCEGCSRRYREALKEKQRAIDALFE
ncbi:hypothetical protein [Enorma phocaeensis]|uniref:hypothetical protein n=1 Tax=Enorma phocaeensis TaxID=1871019 RepID=UPI002353BDA7|nr:hypothetical protein [Enorma phocaeensis]